MESQLELNKERQALLEKFRQALPDLRTTLSATGDVVYREGALSTKIKQLIALAISIRAGFTFPILAHTMRALEAGANTEEVLETLSVGVAMSGTTAVGESLRVIKLLDELGKL